MSFDAAFENVWKKFATEGEFEIPLDVKPCLKQAMIFAGFDKIDMSDAETASTVSAVKQKKVSGYNLFMKETMAQLKAQEVPSTERMGKVSKMWTDLSETDKNSWKEKAAALTPVSAPVDVSQQGGKKEKKPKKERTGPSKRTGYQIFIKDNMVVVKTDATIDSKGRMGKLAGMWKALSETEQAIYKKKADDFNQSQASSVATGVSTEGGDE